MDSAKRANVDFNEALTLTGFGKFNIFLLLANGGCLSSVILETTGMMFVSPAAECDLNLTLTTKGYLASASFLGVVIGSHFWGFMADTRGRKKTIVISMIGSFFLTLISSFAAWDWLFILLRFLNGLFISASSSIVYVYCGEFHNDSTRPKMVSGLATFVGIGNMLLSALAWLILSYEWAYEIPFLGIIYRPWRLLVIAYGLPGIIFGLCIFGFPESPKYLLTQKDSKGALKILQTMYKINTGNPKDKFPVSGFLENEENNEVESKANNFLKNMLEQTLTLISKPLILKTFMVCTLQFGAFGIGTGLLMWYPEILNKMTAHEKQMVNNETSLCSSVEYYTSHLQEYNNESLVNVQRCTDFIHTEVFLVFITVAAFLVIVYTIVGSLINFVGKKNILVGLLSISAVAGLISQYVSGANIVKTFMGLALISTTTIGVINAIVVDMYATRICAMALAISLMIGRIGAFVGSHVQGLIFYQLCNYTFHIYAAVNIVLIIIVILLPTSTQEPKTIKTIT